ncbi:MAG: TRAP transporter TatT component family protein [Acidobacteriota bacterium]
MVLVAALLLLPLPGCSIKQMAINTLGNALAEGSSTFARDDDPELVRDAIPFALKTIESLIEQSPRHEGLLMAACSGFTQYAYAFIQQPADFVEAEDLDRATAMRQRAKKLYLRGLDYGLRALEVDFPGIRDRLGRDPVAALARTTREDVPLLYWTGAAWGAAFAIDKADSSLSVEQVTIEALMTRAITLDDTWERGSLHDFFITWEGGRSSVGGSLDRAREHFDRARALSAGQRVSPLVTYAEVVSVGTQNKEEFVQLLNEALAIDVYKAAPEQRLANIIAQRRARWLLSRVDELFIDEAGAGRRTQEETGP